MQRRAVGVGVVTRVCGWLTRLLEFALATTLPEDVTPSVSVKFGFFALFSSHGSALLRHSAPSARTTASASSAMVVPFLTHILATSWSLRCSPAGSSANASRSASVSSAP